MKKIIVVLIVAVTFGFSGITFAEGITGGTARNTTDEQREQTREGGTHKDISKKNFNRIRSVLEKIPVVGTHSKLVRGMSWIAEKQRKAGGVTMTGGTTKED